MLLALLALSGDLVWESSPEAAAEKARAEGKAVLVVHLSGIYGDDLRT